LLSGIVLSSSQTTTERKKMTTSTEFSYRANEITQFQAETIVNGTEGTLEFDEAVDLIISEAKQDGFDVLAAFAADPSLRLNRLKMLGVISTFLALKANQ